jgi:peptide/nickel transport system permease protein
MSGADIHPPAELIADLAAEPLAAPVARRRRRLGLIPALPIAILVMFVFVAIFAPLLTPYDPVRNDLINSLLPPAFVEGGVPEHPLGTDGFGRDVLSRLMYGARVSLSVAAVSLVIAVIIGTLVGVSAGYFGGAIDGFLMRVTDILLALPTLLVALVIAIALGPSFQNLVLVLGLLIWPRIARLLRGETLVLRKMDFVRYSRAIGVSSTSIVRGHVFHNILPTLLVATTLEIGAVILRESSISFLGAGLPPPQPSWGAMIAEGEGLIATGWWITVFPGLCIVGAVLACNAFGDWLRDRLDPKTQRQ